MGQLVTPLWITGANGVSFAAMGLVLLLDGFAALRRLRGWLAFGPGERHFTTRTGVGAGAASVTTVAEGDELGGRIAFGVVAVLLDLLSASPLLVWLWRRVHPSSSPTC